MLKKFAQAAFTLKFYLTVLFSTSLMHGAVIHIVVAIASYNI